MGKLLVDTECVAHNLVGDHITYVKNIQSVKVIKKLYRYIHFIYTVT